MKFTMDRKFRDMFCIHRDPGRQHGLSLTQQNLVGKSIKFSTYVKKVQPHAERMGKS